MLDRSTPCFFFGQVLVVEIPVLGIGADDCRFMAASKVLGEESVKEAGREG